MLEDKIGTRLGVINSPGYRPFINAFKQAWPWQGDKGGMQWDALVSGGYMTPGGQLIAVAPGSEGFRTRILENLPAESGASGRHRVRWEGSGTIDLYGARNIDRSRPNEITFDYTANGSSFVDFVVRTVNRASGHLRNIRVSHEADWADEDAGAIFRRQFIEETKWYGTLRFDEWIGILTSEQQGGLRITSWESRGLPTDEIFYRFVPYEWMAALCRIVKRDMWVCLPTASTLDHQRKAAALIRSLVPAPIKVHCELSTKTWDHSGTPQAHYFARVGRETFGTNTGSEFISGYAMRATQMALEWLDVWGDDPRLVLIIQHQTDNDGAAVDTLEAPLWRTASAAGRAGVPRYVAPHSVFDLLAVHAQIDGNMSYGGQRAWIESLRTTLPQAEAFDRLRDRMLSGGGRTVAALRTKWDNMRREAAKHGVGMASYEVGNHINDLGDNSAFRSFMHAFSVSPQMGQVYVATLRALDDVGFEGPLCVSVDCRTPDRNVMHGLQRWLGDRNPAWQAVRALVDDSVPVVTPPAPEPEPEPEPTPEPQPEPEPVDPTPTPDPEPEQPNMPDRAKLTELLSYLRSSVASMLTQIEELQTYLDGQVVTPDPEVDPVDPTPAPVPASPIWDLYKQSILTIPTSVTVPAGAADIYIPVSVDNCDRSSFMAYVDRLVNVSGGGINVGTATQQRSNFAGMDVVYHWSPGDEPLHWVKISPRSRYADGRSFKVSIRVKGLGDKQKGGQVTIRFAAGAPEQEITQPFHRPLRRLDLSRAARKNTFNPATLKHSPTGAGGTWMTALSHGRSQDGNQETGLYADATISGAESPITYDATENAIRLHSTGYANPVEWDNRMWRYQAAVLQGLHMDEVCGVEGVWRMEAKIPVRRYSWPAFWLVNRSKNSQGVAYNQWPGEIDILEKFNHAWGAADTPFTSSFAQHFGPLGRWEQKVGSFGNDFDVDQYGSPRTPLDEVYTSWAVHVAYDPIDTTKSEVTFFVNDREVGCQILHARHQDLNRKIEFYPIFNVAVKTPRGDAGVDLYSPERYNTDDGRGKTGDMLVRDVAYYPTGATFA